MFQTLRRRFLENPLIGRELSTSLTSYRIGMISLIVAAAYLVADLICYFFFSEVSNYQTLPFEAGAFLHLAHTIVAYGSVGIFVPIRLMGHIESARTGKAFDQVVVTGVSPLRLVLGNWGLTLAYAGVVLMIGLPFQVLALSFGGVGWTEIFSTYVILWIYTNVIIAVTLGVSVLVRDWQAIPAGIAFAAIVGIVSMVPVIPAELGDVGPLRMFWRYGMPEAFIDASGMPTGVSSLLFGEPRLLHATVPHWLYAPLLWAVIAAPFVVLVVFGPHHRFTPGLNVFGTVVLPGDVALRFARRLRANLVRRVEMAFFYENRPRWCGGWDFPARLVSMLAFLALAWGICMGVVYDFEPRARPFRRDEAFLAGITISLMLLFAWFLYNGHTRRHADVTERIGPLRISHRSAVTIAFALGLGAFVLTQYLSHLDAVSSFQSLTIRKDQTFDLAEYEIDWARALKLWTIFAVNVFLVGQVLGCLISSVFAWRWLMTMATVALLAGPAIAWGLYQEGLVPQDVGDVGAFSPFARYFYPSRFPSAPLHANGMFLNWWFFAVMVFTLGMILFTRKIRKGARRQLAAATAVLVVASFGGVDRVAAQGGDAVDVPDEAALDAGADVATSEFEGDDEDTLDLEIVEVVRGFEGRTFSHTAQFLTLRVRNSTSEPYTGKLRTSHRVSPVVLPFELGAETTKIFRVGLEGSWGGGDQFVVEFALHDGRTKTLTLDPIVVAAPSTQPGQSHEGGRFLFVGEDRPPTPLRWAQALVDGRMSIVRARAFVLPEDPVGYTGCSTVFFGPGDYTRLTEEQRLALFDFVRLGGSVVFYGRHEWSAIAQLEPWSAWFEGAEFPRVGELAIPRLKGGRTIFEWEDGNDSRLAARTWGPGRVGVANVDFASESLPRSRSLWASFTAAVPKSVYPAIPLGDRWDRDLSGFGSLGGILVYFGLYALVVGPILMVLHRKKSRRKYLWPFLGASILVFCCAIPILDWAIHIRPSLGRFRRVVYIGADSESAVSLAHVRVRSSGRQRHALDLKGNTAILGNSWFGPSGVVARVPRSPGAEGGAPFSAITPPWGSLDLYVVDDGPPPVTPIKASATFDAKTRVLSYEVEFDRPPTFPMAMVFYNFSGEGELEAKRIVSKADRRFRGKLTVRKGGSGSNRNIVGRGWSSLDEFSHDIPIVYGTRLAMYPGDGPRLGLVWVPPEEIPLPLETSDIEFWTEMTSDNQRRFTGLRRPLRLVEKDGKPYLSRVITTIFQEIPLAIE